MFPSFLKAALSDDNEKIDKPCQSLRIVGEVRRLNEEEEEYVKKLCEERFGREVDDEDEDEDDDESDEESTEEMEETGVLFHSTLEVIN